LHNERTGYPTQKPAGLMERIVRASSNPGDMIADFFCGSGTTAFAAAKHGRQFIACDATIHALHTARGRLIDSQVIFSLERDSDFDFPVSPSANSLKAHVVSDSIYLETDLDIDYWEVDPAWDGKIFRSAAQAKRPVRNGNIQLQLKIKAGRNNCIRLITVQGEQFQLHVKAISNASDRF